MILSLHMSACLYCLFVLVLRVRPFYSLRMYQHKVDVDMLNAIKSVLWHPAYPHQPYIDTFYVLPLRRCRPKLVLTGTSIPFYSLFPDPFYVYL